MNDSASLLKQETLAVNQGFRDDLDRRENKCICPQSNEILNFYATGFSHD